MKTLIICCIGSLTLLIGSLYGMDNVKIQSIHGVVKVRQGLEETWHPASKGMLLKPIDTILTLEGKAVIVLQDGLEFHVDQNAVLDISDLRKITKREIFLYLMSEKINGLPEQKKKSRLQIGNVSVVHGTSKEAQNIGKDSVSGKNWIRVFNGAKILYQNGFYANTIIKLHKSLKVYTQLDSEGEAYFYLGMSFEKMNESGHAIDAYQAALEKTETSSSQYWVEPARESIQRLKKSTEKSK